MLHTSSTNLELSGAGSEENYSPSAIQGACGLVCIPVDPWALAANVVGVITPYSPCCPVSLMLPLLPQGDPEPLFFFSKEVRILFCKLWGFS